MNITDVHAATFNYNYVFRALWGEKWCMSPLQDLEETQAKHKKTMTYRTVGPEKNTPGFIAIVAQELASILAFVHHHDPDFLKGLQVIYIQKHIDMPGVISPRTMCFRAGMQDLNISLTEGMLFKVSESQEEWEATMSFKTTWDFYDFIDAYHEVKYRWREIMAAKYHASFIDCWDKVNRIFFKDSKKLHSVERIHTLRVYRELANMIVDVHLGKSDIPLDSLFESIRFECIGNESAPIRDLFSEVRAIIKNKEAEIL